MNTVRRVMLVIGLIAVLAVGVSAQEAVAEANLVDACVENYDPAVDYFPAKAEIEYAENFSVEYFNNYKVVTILPWPGAEAPQTYVLVQCGTPRLRASRMP